MYKQFQGVFYCRPFSILILLAIMVVSCQDLEQTKTKQPTLKVQFSKDSWNSILTKRGQYLKTDVILASKQDFVNASLTYKDSVYQVKLRLKGDWTDHLDGKHWSYRVHSQDTILGMQRFNLHYPSRKGYSYQWLFFKACEYEGIITPFHDFIWLAFNSDTILYQIEEHFDFPMLIRNGLPKSPIVRFDESQPWEGLASGIEWTHKMDSIYYYKAEIDAFRTSNITNDSVLSLQYEVAKSKLEGFRNHKLKTEEVFHIPSLAKYFALCDLFGGAHGLRWHNVRYYFNSEDQLLYPIAFDNSCGNTGMSISMKKEGLNKDFMKDIFNSKQFTKAYFKEVHKITSKDYIDHLLEQITPEHKQIIRLLKLEFPHYDFSSKFLFQNADQIRSTLKL